MALPTIRPYQVLFLGHHDINTILLVILTREFTKVRTATEYCFGELALYPKGVCRTVSEVAEVVLLVWANSNHVQQFCNVIATEHSVRSLDAYTSIELGEVMYQGGYCPLHAMDSCYSITCCVCNMLIASHSSTEHACCQHRLLPSTLYVRVGVLRVVGHSQPHGWISL
jgi:hypothetical protein